MRMYKLSMTKERTFGKQRPQTIVCVVIHVSTKFFDAAYHVIGRQFKL
jgi:hypothetical protein